MNTLSLTGVILLYVGVVLFINGLSLLNKIDRKEIVFIDFFVGVLTFLIACHLIFREAATSLTIRAGAFTLLFSCTYLWVAFNHYREASDERGLGWYCLFVSLTAFLMTLFSFREAKSTWEFWLAICWGIWTVLWFLYFLNIIFSKGNPKNIGWFTLFAAVVSAWIPGALLLFE